MVDAGLDTNRSAFVMFALIIYERLSTQHQVVYKNRVDIINGLLARARAAILRPLFWFTPAAESIKGARFVKLGETILKAKSVARRPLESSPGLGPGGGQFPSTSEALR